MLEKTADIILLVRLTSIQPMLVCTTIALILFAIILSILYFQYNKLKKYSSREECVRMHREKAMLTQLIDLMPDAIYMKDRDSRFLIANKHLGRKMGKGDSKLLIGKTDFDFYPKELAQEFFEDEQRIMKEGQPMINKEEKGLDIDGNQIDVSTTKIPIYDNDNKVIGIVGIGRDITRQKQAENTLIVKSKKLEEANALLNKHLEEINQLSKKTKAQDENLQHARQELERLSMVARKTANVVIIMDNKGNFEWVNEGFEKKYGMDLKTFIEQRGSNLRDNSAYESISEILKHVIETGKPVAYQSENIGSYGKTEYNLTHLTPVFGADDKISNLILVDSDITDLKVAEQEIKLKNETISQKSEELTKLNVTKDKLFSIIGHDLKNPLNSIIGFSELIQSNWSSLNEDQIKKYNQVILESSLSAQYLLENLLAWARMQTGRLQYIPTRVSIKSLIENVMSLQKASAEKKNINLVNEVIGDLKVVADENMINTVIRNITSNAIKFSNEHGRVIFSAAKQKNMAKITVKDEGVGMDKDTVKNLFVLETDQSKPGTSGEQGTGLGLIICKEFIEINQGTIEVISKPGKGSSMIIFLPIAE